MNWADREYAIGRGVAAIRHRTIPELQPFVRAVIEHGLPGLLAQATGSTFPNVSAPQLASLWWPPLHENEQRAIARILGRLEDKIELNRGMNETLGAMARALFKSWFLNFDPVRTKAEDGHPGLPRRLADLFSDSFEESELGQIPTGWEVKRLGDLLELSYGKALKAEDRRAGHVPVYGSNGQVGWHDEALTRGPGIVVGRKGNPGIVTWAPTGFFAIDTAFFVVPKARCPSLHFLYHALQSHDLASLGADSAVPGLNRNLAYMSTQVLPPRALIEAFNAHAEALGARAHACTEESRTIASIRDALLPRLVSGELRIEDVEGFLIRAAA